MEVKIWRADPAGNVTLLVESPVAPEDRPAVAARLLREEGLGGEQVGFLTAPRLGGAVRLEMMGGEFCGNAARCAALWEALRRGRGGRVAVELSGCGHVLAAEVGDGSVFAEMPLPSDCFPFPLEGREATAVLFDGIAHLLSEEPLPRERAAEMLSEAAERLGVPAAGWMQLRDGGMIPAVYVRDTGTLFFENSCASGSAAAAYWDAVGKGDGTHVLSLRQPGGIIETEVVRRDGAVRRIRIGGAVTMGEPQTVLLPETP